MCANRRLDLVEIVGFFEPGRPDVAVHQHRKVACRGEIEQAAKSTRIRARRVAGSERREFVVPQENLADALPDSRVERKHPLDVIHSVSIRAVEAADEGMQTGLLILW